MSNYITVKLTEDQARDLIETLEGQLASNRSYLERAKYYQSHTVEEAMSEGIYGSYNITKATDVKKLENKIAFRTRLLNEIKQS